MQLIRNDIILDEDNLTTSTSTIVDLSQLTGIAVQAVCIDEGPDPLNAVIKLQASNDGDNFADIHGASKTLTGSGTTVMNLPTSYFKWLKFVYTPISGQVHLQVRVAARDGKQ